MNRCAAPRSRKPHRWRSQVAAVASQDWPAAYEATGTVRARTTATISSKVMGYVQQVSVQVGDHVREGQPLITLDARDLDVSLRRAEAGRAEVESAIPELENATAAAKANLDLAQATFQRMRRTGRQEIDFQPGVGRSLGAAQGGPGELRDGRAPGAPN